jgi:NAD(P)-dependent dehydrogenase (short-subunit alcohol dehydrogenase family)
MNLKEKTVIVTGGARGIGKALSKRFAREGANVVVADLLEHAAQETADSINGLVVACDVRKESDIQNLVTRTEQHFGPIDLFCSNAGVCFGEPDTATSASNEVWQTCWEIHVMAHVYAARTVLPGMIKRGGGYFLQMASAAALLNQIGDAAYSTTKHAALGFAESLAITHADDGIVVSVVCPQ